MRLTRPTSLTSLAVLALLSSVALVGCGDDGGGISISKESAATTTVAEDDDGGEASDDDRDALIAYVQGVGEDNIDPEAGECVADAILDLLSADGLDTVREGGDFDLADFESDDSSLMVGALDECVDLDQALRAFSEGISSEAGLPLTDEEAQCVTSEFAADYQGAGEFIEAVSAMDEEESGARFFEALGPCMTPDTAVTFLATVFAGEGLDETTSTCVAQGLVDLLGVEATLQAMSEASMGETTTLEDATTEVAAACGDAGFGGDGTVPDIGGDIGGGLSGN